MDAVKAPEHPKVKATEIFVTVPHETSMALCAAVRELVCEAQTLHRNALQRDR
jgi:hypothetical protein